MSERDAVDLLLDLAEGIGTVVVSEVADALVQQPRQEIRARIKLARFKRRLERIRKRNPTAFRSLRARVLEARIDNQRAILEALDEIEAT